MKKKFFSSYGNALDTKISHIIDLKKNMQQMLKIWCMIFILRSEGQKFFIFIKVPKSCVEKKINIMNSYFALIFFYWMSTYLKFLIHKNCYSNERISLLINTSSPSNKLEITQRFFCAPTTRFHLNNRKQKFQRIITWAETLNHTKATAKIWC